MEPVPPRLALLVTMAVLLMLATEIRQSAMADSRSNMVVDVVSLKSGRTLRGAILNRSADGTMTIAVSRAWLQKSNPQEFDALTQHDAEQQRAAWLETKDRIETQLADPPESTGMVFFLKQERQRLEKLLAEKTPPEKPFVVIDVPAAQVAKLQPAAPDRQRLALFAWDQGLTGVETRTAESLQKELVKQGVDWKGPAPDLSEQVPVRPQSSAEWSARLAIVEYTFNEALDFQGMGDTLVRTGADQPIDLAAVLPKLLTRQFDSLLGDLLQPERNLKPAAPPNDNYILRTAFAAAEKEQRHGFRVTRLDVNAERLTVTVEARFVAQLSKNEWQTIWSHTETADGRQARPDLEARIAEDPQVKSALTTIKSLGLGADDSLNQAIRVGAATMAAQSTADARFFEFRDRYAKRLDGPVLAIAIAKP
jgi:hypothetical protein